MVLPIRLGPPLEHLHGFARLEPGEDPGRHRFIGHPRRVECQPKRSGPNALEGDRGRGHASEEAAFATAGMFGLGIVPLVGVRDRDHAVAEGETGPPLVPGDPHPERRSRERPASPLIDPTSGHLLAIRRPARRRRWRPCRFVTRFHRRRTQDEIVERFLEQRDELRTSGVVARRPHPGPLGAHRLGLRPSHHPATAFREARGAKGGGTGRETRLLAPLAPGQSGIPVPDPPEIGRMRIQHPELEFPHVLARAGVHGVVAVGSSGGVGRGEPVLEPDPLVAHRTGIVTGGRGELEVGREVPVTVRIPEFRAAKHAVIGREVSGPGLRLDRGRPRRGGVAMTDGDVVDDLVVFRIELVAPRDPTHPERRVLAVLDLHQDEAPVHQHLLELRMVGGRVLAPPGEVALGRRDVDPEVVMIAALSSFVGVGVAEEVDRRLAGLGRETLQSTDDLAGPVGVARGPGRRLMRVMKLGENEVDDRIVRRLRQNLVEPVELGGGAIPLVRIEADHPDVPVILVPPVLLEPGRAVLRQVEVVEEPVRILLVIPRDGIDRHVPGEVLLLVEELVLPLVVLRPRVDQVTGNEREGEFIGDLRPELRGHEPDHAFVDHLRVFPRVRPRLGVGVDDETEGVTRITIRRGPKAEGAPAIAFGIDGVVVGGIGIETLQHHMVDSRSVLPGNRIASSHAPEFRGRPVPHLAPRLALGLPDDPDAGGLRILEEGPDPHRRMAVACEGNGGPDRREEERSEPGETDERTLGSEVHRGSPDSRRSLTARGRSGDRPAVLNAP